MALDPAKIGFSYPQTAPYVVGREKIREFAEAIGAGDPVHFDVDAAAALGYADVIAPPTFPILLTLPAGWQVSDDPELGIDYTRVVHGEQKFLPTRPVTVGDRLQVVVTIESIRSAAGNDLISTRADVVTEAGELVGVAHGLMVVRGPDPVTP